MATDLKARRELFKMFLQRAEESNDLENQRIFRASIKKLDEELAAADPTPHRLAREGAEAARAMQLSRGPSRIYGDPVKLCAAIRDRAITAKTHAERELALSMLDEIRPDLPPSLANEATIMRAARVEDSEAFREGAALARQVQPRSGR